MAFAPSDDLGEALAHELRKEYGRVSYERVLTWSALSKLHALIAAREGRASGGPDAAGDPAVRDAPAPTRSAPRR